MAWTELRIGELLGKPPGKGPGRGNKTLPARNVLSPKVQSQFRKMAWPAKHNKAVTESIVAGQWAWPETTHAIQACLDVVCSFATNTPSIIDANGRHDFRHRGKEGHDASNQAKLIVAFAEERAGQEIQRMQDKGELATKGNPDQKSQDATFQLADLDITKSDSSRFQLAAEVLESDEGWFDEHVVECNEGRKDFTQQAVIHQGSR